jgi:hypothetical protein
MGTSSWMATTLDIEMLAGQAVISPPNTPENALPVRPGPVIATEIGDRFLVRYLRQHQIGWFEDGSPKKQWVTLTAYAPEEAVPWLALSPGLPIPTHALMLDPRQIGAIAGPRYIRLGQGVEYVLPQGFPKAALVPPGWPTPVR